MKRRCTERASLVPKSTVRSEKKPTRSSKRRGIIGFSGSFTRLQWASTLCAGRWAPAAPPPPPPPPAAPPVAAGTPVWVASISTLVGKASARSMYERVGSIVPRMAAISGTDVVNRRVMSTTGALSGPNVSTLSTAMMGA